MGVYAAIISGVISTGVKLLGSSGGPDYPSAPKMTKLPVQKAKKHMEKYEQERMDASIQAWKDRFPLLFKGGQFEIEDLKRAQQGKMSKTIEDTLRSSGLEVPTGANFGSGAGSQEALGMDVGLNPITLSQRTSQAVQRQIAMNPEWTNKITGGTLASMLANSQANQNVYQGFLGAQRAAMYQTRAAQGAANTQALLSLPAQAARTYANYSDAFNPAGYQQAVYPTVSEGVFPTTPAGYAGGPASGGGAPAPNEPSPAATDFGNTMSWTMAPVGDPNYPMADPYANDNTWSFF